MAVSARTEVTFRGIRLDSQIKHSLMTAYNPKRKFRFSAIAMKSIVSLRTQMWLA